jgi:outer membrane protein assembly factor BamB
MKSSLRMVGLLALFASLSLVTLGQAQLPSAAGDWPGFRGPDRNGVSKEVGLLRQWPAGGPPLAWKLTGLGDGYGAPAIAAGKLFVMGTKGRIEHVHCIDLTDRKILWSSPLGNMAGGYPGPRCTPSIDGNRLYALGSDGRLVCLDTADGRQVWNKDLKSDFGGKTGNWAYAESPLIDGDRLICTPGGDKATLLCLDKKTGSTIWQSSITGLKVKDSERAGKRKGGSRPYNQAGYASAIVAEVDGLRQYVQFLAGGVVGVDASNGKLLWHYDEPASPTANCSAPLFGDNSVFAASGYGTGGGRARITRDGNGLKAEQLYFVKSLQNHHGGMVLVGDHVYGTGSQTLLCVNFKTGEIAWQARGVGKGSVTYADGHIYHRSENGDIALVEANPTAYKEKGRFSQPDRSKQKAWAYPVVAGGKLYLRDWDVLLCYDVTARN